MCTSQGALCGDKPILKRYKWIDNRRQYKRVVPSRIHRRPDCCGHQWHVRRQWVENQDDQELWRGWCIAWIHPLQVWGRQASDSNRQKRRHIYVVSVCDKACRSKFICYSDYHVVCVILHYLQSHLPSCLFLRQSACRVFKGDEGALRQEWPAHVLRCGEIP